MAKFMRVLESVSISLVSVCTTNVSLVSDGDGFLRSMLESALGAQFEALRPTNLLRVSGVILRLSIRVVCMDDT